MFANCCACEIPRRNRKPESNIATIPQFTYRRFLGGFEMMTFSQFALTLKHHEKHELLNGCSRIGGTLLKSNWIYVITHFLVLSLSRIMLNVILFNIIKTYVNCETDKNSVVFGFMSGKQKFIIAKMSFWQWRWKNCSRMYLGRRLCSFPANTLYIYLCPQEFHHSNDSVELLIGHNIFTPNFAFNLIELLKIAQTKMNKATN